MKKRSVIGLFVLICVSFLFVSCVNGGLDLKSAMKSVFTLKVTEHSCGPALTNADVFVYNQNGELISSGKTNELGEVSINVIWNKEIGAEFLVDMSIVKENFSPSKIENLKLEGSVDAFKDNGVVEAMAYMARINDDMPLPEFDIDFLKLDGTPADLSNLTLADTIFASVSSEDYYLAVYAGINFLPGYLGGSVGEAGGPFAQTTQNSVFPIDIIGATGTACLNLILYDTNYGRVNYKYEINIDDAGLSFPNRSAPTEAQYVMRTSDSPINYWLSTGRQEDESKSDFVNLISSRGAPEKTWMYMRASFTHTTQTDGIIGYNLYRSTNGVNYDLASYWPYPYTIAYDPGIGLNYGQKYWYKIETVYLDGSTSNDANVVEIVPFDIFKVKHITPQDKAENVGRRPNLSWKPIGTDGNLADVSCGLLPDASITYYYLPTIRDNFSEEWNYYTNITPNGYFQFITTEGALPVTLEFLSEEMFWAVFDGAVFTDFENFQSDGLEAFKSYQWGHLVAVAEYVGPDNDLNGEPDSMVMSITSDKYGFFDIFGNDPEEYNYFTTGQEY